MMHTAPLLVLYSLLGCPTPKETETGEPKDTGVAPLDLDLELTSDSLAVLGDRCKTSAAPWTETVTVVADRPAGDWTIENPYIRRQNVYACYQGYLVGQGTTTGLEALADDATVTDGLWIDKSEESGVRLTLPPGTQIDGSAWESGLVFYFSPQIPGTTLLASTEANTAALTPFRTPGSGELSIEVEAVELEMEGSGSTGLSEIQTDFIRLAVLQWGSHNARQRTNEVTYDSAAEGILVDVSTNNNTVGGLQTGTVVGSNAGFDSSDFSTSTKVLVVSAVYLSYGYESNVSSTYAYTDAKSYGLNDSMGGECGNFYVMGTEQAAAVAAFDGAGDFCSSTETADNIYQGFLATLGDETVPSTGGFKGQIPGLFVSDSDDSSWDVNEFPAVNIVGRTYYKNLALVDLEKFHGDLSLASYESDEGIYNDIGAGCWESVAALAGLDVGSDLSTLPVGTKIQLTNENMLTRWLDEEKTVSAGSLINHGPTPYTLRLQLEVVSGVDVYE